MFKFQVNIIDVLKNNGYSLARIRKEKLIGEQTLQNMKKGIVPGIKTLDTICGILKCQPGMIIEWKEDEKI